MYNNDVTPTWFLLWQYLYNLVFADKKKVNSEMIAHVDFCASEMSTKFWDFAAGMDLTPNKSWM